MYLSTQHIIKPNCDFTSLNEIYHSLAYLENEYPHFNQWFYDKVIRGICNNHRSVIVKRIGGEIAGIAILKDASEKKISTLRVIDKFKGMGIGSELVRHSFDLLNTDKPLITVAASRYDEFEKLLTQHNFTLSQSLRSFYKANEIELCFNGKLIEENIPFIA